MASERILLLSLSQSPVSVSYSRSTFTCWQIVTHEFIIERISVVTKATISSQCADIRPSDGDGFNLLIQCNGYGYIGSQWQCHGCSHAEQRKDFWSNLEQPPPRGNPVPRAKPRKSALNSCHMMFSSSTKLVVVVIVVVVLLLLLHTPLSPRILQSVLVLHGKSRDRDSASPSAHICRSLPPPPPPLTPHQVPQSSYSVCTPPSTR